MPPHYGVAHAVIVALGCSPGLGFIHTGHDRSFVYDIADLYKAEVAIPVAFEVTAQQPEDISGSTRRAVRDAIRDGSIMSRTARDIRRLLLPTDPDATSNEPMADVVQLWDERHGMVPGGHSYTTHCPHESIEELTW